MFRRDGIGVRFELREVPVDQVVYLIDAKRRALRLIELAARYGLGVQLGCHPGETALLSAAGRHLASNLTGLRYVEGSYDRHILSANLTKDDLTFRYGGWAKPIEGPGLGVRVDLDALEAMTVTRREICYG